MHRKLARVLDLPGRHLGLLILHRQRKHLLRRVRAIFRQNQFKVSLYLPQAEVYQCVVADSEHHEDIVIAEFEDREGAVITDSEDREDTGATAADQPLTENDPEVDADSGE